MKAIKKLESYEVGLHEIRLGQKINEIVDRVNELSKPVEATKEEPISDGELHRALMEKWQELIKQGSCIKAAAIMHAINSLF